MSASEEELHPLDAHARRDPLTGAGVRVIVLTAGDPTPAAAIAQHLERLLAECGRHAEHRVVDVTSGWCQALEEGLAGASLPLVLVTTAAEPWTRAHLDPLLASIDKCDHALGRRRLGVSGRLGRWLRTLGSRVVFGIPVVDVHTPCQIHRRGFLERIPLQSRSAFLDVEVLAKATFLGHLLDEVAVPPLPARLPARSAWGDFRAVFHRPTFNRVVLREGEAPSHQASSPAEDPQRDHERTGGPGPEDQH